MWGTASGGLMTHSSSLSSATSSKSSNAAQPTEKNGIQKPTGKIRAYSLLFRHFIRVLLLLLWYLTIIWLHFAEYPTWECNLFMPACLRLFFSLSFYSRLLPKLFGEKKVMVGLVLTISSLHKAFTYDVRCFWVLFDLPTSSDDFYPLASDIFRLFLA